MKWNVLRDTFAGTLIFASGTFLYLQSSVADDSSVKGETSLDTLTVVGFQGKDDIDSRRNVESEILGTIGGANIIDPSDLQPRSPFLEDVFRFDPGVYAREGGATGDVRLSIRGSGAQRRFGNRGLHLMIDGLTANNADGSFYTRAFDPLATDYISVFRGPNASPYGLSTFGGAIDFVTKTGVSDPGPALFLEGGSFESHRTSTAYGIHDDRFDARIQYTYNSTSGYRDYSDGDTGLFNFNVGYQLTDKIQTRFYTHYSNSNATLPGSLSEQQVDEDPTQAAPGFRGQFRRDLATFRLAQKTVWKDDSSTFLFGTYYNKLDFDHPVTIGLIDYESDDVGVNLRATHDYELFGASHSMRASFVANYGENNDRGFRQFSPFMPPQARDLGQTSTNYQWYLENDTLLNRWLHAVYGVGFQRALRDQFDRNGDENLSETYTGATPRAGLLAELSETASAYINYSESFEAPTYSEVTGTITPLDEQTARGFEVGVREQLSDPISGEITFYRYEVDDEFITFEDPPNSGRTFTGNFDTIHQGIEFGSLVNVSKLLSGERQRVELLLDQRLQWNDFRFDDGTYTDNNLPGIAETVYTSRLQLTDSERWNLAAIFDFVPSGFFVDNNNSAEFKANGYFTLGVTGQLKVYDETWLFVDARNLTDERYISSASIVPNASALQTVDVYNPGDGASVFAGVRFRM